jgi:hypothetical protein
MSRKNIIRIGAAVVLLFLIGLIIYSFVPRATLVMSVAPEEFTVTIDGKNTDIKTGDSITVTPGDVSFKISRDGFDDYTQTISIKNGERVEILQALNPKTDEARRLLNSDVSQAIIQRVTNVKLQKTTNDLTKTYPLLAELPINDKFYTVSLCESRLHPDDASKVAVCVTLYDPEAKQSAIDDVNGRGFDLNEYETYYEAPIDESTIHEPHEDDGTHID